MYKLLTELTKQVEGRSSSTDIIVTPATSTLVSPWYDKIIYDPVNAISISLGAAGVILGIIPLILLVAERRKRSELDETLKEFGIRKQLVHLLAETEQKAKLTQEQKAKLDAEAQSMREDVEQRIPNAALTAYYENTIPHLENEILAFGARAAAMQEDLARIRKLPTVKNEKVQALISNTISQTAAARRQLEALQLFLILCTSVTGAIVSVIPYPFSHFAGFLFGGITILIVLKMVGPARAAYPDSKLLTSRFLSPRLIANFLAITVASIFLMFVILVLVLKRY